jgi:hypothetical protein
MFVADCSTSCGASAASEQCGEGKAALHCVLALNRGITLTITASTRKAWRARAYICKLFSLLAGEKTYGGAGERGCETL